MFSGHFESAICFEHPKFLVGGKEYRRYSSLTHSWGKTSSREYQHQELSSLYIVLIKYIAGCIHPLIQDVCLHEAYGSQFGKALQSG